jgi:hypothetical protein
MEMVFSYKIFMFVAIGVMFFPAHQIMAIALPAALKKQRGVTHIG